ncbi:MAG TPA: hypothetical protein VKN36_12800, partial [Eudoraea sp.]|nr:hypothetical protein [Eudoraea sp.]
MKRSISFFAILSSLLILQGCCSLKIPAIEAQFPLIDELTCAGKGVHVSLDRFIIRLNVPMTDDQIVTMMELALPDHKPISLERCKCGDPDLMMIILGEAMENKGDLLTTVSGLRGGSMNSDPALVYKLKHSVYHKIPQLPASGGPLNPDIADFISDESDAMIVVVLDSGLDLNRFAGKKFLMQNPTGLNCIVGGEPSS